MLVMKAVYTESRLQNEDAVKLVTEAIGESGLCSRRQVTLRRDPAPEFIFRNMS